MKELEEQRVCVWNFVANFVKILQRHFNCLAKHTGKGSPKKKLMSRSKIEVLFVVFFDRKGIIHHEFVPSGQIVNKVVPGGFSAFEGCRAQEEAWNVGKRDLDVAPQQCAGSRVAPHPQLSGKASDIRCAPSTLFSGLSPSRLFPVSQN